MENKTTKSFLNELNEEFEAESMSTGKESQGENRQEEKGKGEAVVASPEKTRKRGKGKKKPSKIGKKSIIAVAVVAILVLIVVIILSTRGVTQLQIDSERNQMIEKYEDILTEGEKENWRTMEVSEDSRLYMDLNTIVPVEEASKKATIRLVNPPYSPYGFRVSYTLNNEEETLLYASNLLNPGTIENQVTFLETLEKGEHEATASYVFYKEDGTELPSYPVSVKIVVE